MLQNTGFPNPMRNVVMAACIFQAAIDDKTAPYMPGGNITQYTTNSCESILFLF